MSEMGLKGRLRLGYIVFGVLVGMKVAEYLIGTRLRSGAWPYLAILAVVGAWSILYYFMHIHQLSGPRSKGDE